MVRGSGDRCGWSSVFYIWVVCESKQAFYIHPKHGSDRLGSGSLERVDSHTEGERGKYSLRFEKLEESGCDIFHSETKR